MILSRRNFFRAALAAPIGASFVHYTAFAAPAMAQIKITAVKIIQLTTGLKLVKVETDAGFVGYGPVERCRAGPGTTRSPMLKASPREEVTGPGSCREGPTGD